MWGESEIEAAAADLRFQSLMPLVAEFKADGGKPRQFLIALCRLNSRNAFVFLV